MCPPAEKAWPPTATHTHTHIFAGVVGGPPCAPPSTRKRIEARLS